MTDQLQQKFLTIPIPTNETERLAALHRYKILDTPPDAAFDRITTLAARLFNMPIALISLVDESRAWFKSCIGFDAREVPRDATLCSFAVLTNEPLIIPDTRLDEHFSCNPFVQSEPGVRFYAGAPLLSHDGFNLGTLCLLDGQPRDSLSAEQQATLVDLAAMVVDELELRLAANKIAQVDTALLKVTQGVATVTGEAYFDALVQHFAKVLDADYVYLGLLEGDDSTKMLRTIATCAHGQIVENLEYPLQETPCWEVIEQRKICCYPRHAQAQFPNAPLLKPLAVESYVAIPFFDSSGTPLGLLGVMDGKPLENVQLAESLLTIFALRIATELERQLLEQERERFLAVGSDLQVITKADGYFQWVSPSFERLLGWTVEEMTSHPWTDFVHPDDISPSVSETSSLFCGSKTLAFENRYRHKDGSYRWLLWKAQLYSEEQVFYGAAVDITERKQSSAALRESEELKQSILESSHDCIKVLTLNSEISYISPGGLRLLEIDAPTSILNNIWVNYWQGEDHKQAKAAIAAATMGNTGQFHGYLPTAKGTPKWWDSMITPVRDATGQVVQLVVISRDITEARRNEADRQKAELALREAHVQLESALAAGGIYTWRWKIAEDLVIVNAAFAHLFGVDPETAAIGLPIELFVQAMHEEDRSLVVAAINQAISTGEEYVSEYRVHTATGEERWLAARGRVEYASDGRPLAFPGAVADITERKRAEEDRDRFFQLSRDMLAIINTDGYFLQANPAWTETLGYTTQELTAQPYIEFVHPDDRAATTDEAQKIAQGSLTNGFENRYRCRDGSYRWISWSVAPFVEQGLLYCVARDVTERKLAEAERERLLLREQSAREDAEQANRLKDEFLAVLSHELRSPLNPILGWARLLQTGKLDAARQSEALKTIERNARLQSQLIEDLLDISRIMQGKLSLTAAPVNLTLVISAAIETVRLAASAKNVEITLDLDNTIAPISGDATRLQQVVWNLLTNAVKFTLQGGQVTVEVRQLNGLAQMRVIDTGKGINPSFLPYVFEYFRQEDGSTTRKFGGLGLGLAIVRQIVEMHGGTVKADSQGENQGATFIVQLPLMPQAAPIAPEPIITPADTAAPLDNIQILLVDDDSDTREFQAFVLEQSGAKVTAVASGLEALQTLDQLIPDVLVSDVGMADMDGYMLIGLLRARPPNQGGAIPAIALTAYAAEVDRQRAIEAGFQAFLTKPVEAEILVKAITTLLDANQPEVEKSLYR